jgi:hypothetical protein
LLGSVWLVAVVACASPGGKSGDAPPDGGALAACQVCKGTGHDWCSASQTCIDATAACDYGQIGAFDACGDPRLVRPSALPVDCRNPNQTDVRCDVNAPPRSVGSGPNDNFYSYGGGFLDPANHRLVVAFACDICSANDTGVMGVDLVTGDRTLLSGVVQDPLTGAQHAGTGDALTSVDDVQRAPNGMWWELDSISDAAMLHEIDPATGDRTVLYTPEQLGLATSSCTLQGRPLQVGGDGRVFGRPANMVIHPDRKIYLTADRSFDTSPGQPEIDVAAIVELDGAACRVVTAFSPKDSTLAIGSGPGIYDSYGWLTERNGALVSDLASQYLHAIDIATGNRTMLASADPDALLGTGGKFGGGFTALAADGNTVLVTGNSETEAFGGIVAIDLRTGDRTTNAPDAGPQLNAKAANMLPHPTLENVYVMPGQGMITLYEPATGNSIYLSR